MATQFLEEAKIDDIAEHVMKCNQLLKEVSISELGTCASFEDIDEWMQKTGKGLIKMIAITTYPVKRMTVLVGAIGHEILRSMHQSFAKEQLAQTVSKSSTQSHETAAHRHHNVGDSFNSGVLNAIAIVAQERSLEIAVPVSEWLFEGLENRFASFVELKAEIEEFSETAAILNFQNDEIEAMCMELMSIQVFEVPETAWIAFEEGARTQLTGMTSELTSLITKELAKFNSSNAELFEAYKTIRFHLSSTKY